MKQVAFVRIGKLDPSIVKRSLDTLHDHFCLCYGSSGRATNLCLNKDRDNYTRLVHSVIVNCCGDLGSRGFYDCVCWFTSVGFRKFWKTIRTPEQFFSMFPSVWGLFNCMSIRSSDSTAMLVVNAVLLGMPEMHKEYGRQIFVGAMNFYTQKMKLLEANPNEFRTDAIKQFFGWIMDRVGWAYSGNDSIRFAVAYLNWVYQECLRPTSYGFSKLEIFCPDFKGSLHIRRFLNQHCVELYGDVNVMHRLFEPVNANLCFWN